MLSEDWYVRLTSFLNVKLSNEDYLFAIAERATARQSTFDCWQTICGCARVEMLISGKNNR